MPLCEAPCLELGSAPQTPTIVPSSSSSEISSASSPEPPVIRTTPLFRALTMPLPEPEQPPGQEDLERRLPGYRRIVIPRELTLIELLKECSGVTTDEEVLRIREAKLRVIAERVGLRRLHILAPRLRSLTLDGSAISSLRDLGIGLVHLKVLSVNRCGLTSLDGVWGLGALRELHAAGNRLNDLQPLGALQKLHTLNMADNPIVDSNRLWTLGVCGSLRKLYLHGTQLSESPDYRSRVAAVLPMLVYLDDRPLHMDIVYDSDGVFGAASSSSDSEESDAGGGPSLETSLSTAQALESGLETSESNNKSPDPDNNSNEESRNTESEAFTKSLKLRRPATTEGIGTRPRAILPQRPKTAVERSSVAPTKLEILNTLMDKEWRCSGSKLTSHGAVCGNLARSLRRHSGNSSKSFEIEEIVEETVEEASRSIAAEIPRAPCLEDWVRFKQQTGIEIAIDFNERPREVDPMKVIERLEKIERETMERLDLGKDDQAHTSFVVNLPNAAASFASCTRSLLEECESWIAERRPEAQSDFLFEEFMPANMTGRNHYEFQ